MPWLKSICVFCGSSDGRDPSYAESARAFGKILAREKIRLVYGGGHVGIMGALSDSVQKHGGKVLGVIPEFLVKREHADEGANELIVVPDMHERKRIMVEHADAFVALPGGVGTLEEVVEQLTWFQLHRHRKQILLANVDGFWNPLIELLDHLHKEKFMYGGVNYLVADRVEDIIPTFREALKKQGGRHITEVADGM